ncbi:MAG: thiamine phosphate synthase [Anaerocolumna sp.]
MKCDKKTMLLYAVTDRSWTGKKTLFEQVEEALEGGATCIQLREKTLDEDAFLKEALEMKELCRHYKVPFIINDNVELAIKCRADGIHVGQHDMQANNVRTLAGVDMILGVSAQTVEQAVTAEKSGADYLGVGAVFSTSTKLDAGSVSYDTLTEICNAVSIPVCAIGGISKKNMIELKGTGIDGVALVSAIFAAEDIKEECRELKILSQRVVEA